MLRTLLAAACVVCLAAGCSSGSAKADPAPTGLIDATEMRGALLQAADIGPSWAAPDTAPDPSQMVPVCGGDGNPPPVPPGGTAVDAAFADEGDQGAQSLDQNALVYPSISAAGAAQAALKALADSCKASVSVAAAKTSDRDEPAYTETTTTKPLAQGNWKGFVVIRHKQYVAAHAAIADTAVVIINDRNVVLVDAYGIYRLGNVTTGPDFGSDWQKLVGSVVQRVN